MAVCFVVTTSVADAQKGSVSQEGLIPGHLWVMFSQDAPLSVGPGKTGMSFFDKEAARYGVVSIEKAFPMVDKAAAKRTLSESAEKLRYIYDVRYSTPHHPNKVAAALARDPYVIYAEAHPYHYPEEGELLADPDDPVFPGQEHLGHVRLPDAWDTVKGEEGDVVIAIVDGGTNWRHEDLEANVWNNPGEIPGNSIDDDGNGYVDDVRGWNFANGSADPTGLAETPSNTAHGTAIAGAAAVSNNGLGIAGASWNAKFMAINTSCPSMELFCHAYDGITYAFMNGADIINASFTSPAYSRTEEMVMQAALEMGSLVVTTAGNEGINVDEEPGYPASYAGTLSVGGTLKSEDSNVYNYGRSVNVFAPGIDIDVTLPDDRYGTRNGTSFAAPLVSGIAALVKTRNPDFTPQQVREQVRITADNIDAVNPEPPGSYGRGRVNALRAVTETSSPAVRMVEWDWTDEDRDGYWSRGERITITAEFMNFLADAQGLTLQLESDQEWVSVMTDPISLSTLGSGQSDEATFEVLLLSSAPVNTTVLLYSHVTAGSYDDTPDVIRIQSRPVATHATNALETSITGEGNIGYLDLENTSGGDGFRVDDANGNRRDVLFEGGLMVSTGVDRVSDCVRGAVGLLQDEDFTLKENTTIDFQKPGPLTTEYGRLTLVESSDLPLPIGIEIVQESYVDDRPENAEFLVLEYQITNITEAEISDLHVSIFLDWDISPDFETDNARFDDERGMGYVLDDVDAPTVVVGTRLLTDNDKLTYRAVDNPTEIYADNLTGEAFTPQEKWSFMSNGIQTRELTERDVSQMTGAGPYAIPPGESISVAFALVAGTSTTNFLRNADQAKVLWDTVLSSVQTATEDNLEVVTGPFSFSPIYPNPAEAEATLAFRVATASDVRLAVYDVLGRQVRMVWEGRKSSGAHTALWDGRDDAGQRAAPGVYMVRFTATGEGANFQQSRPLVLVR